jgi:hypothetical protein
LNRQRKAIWWTAKEYVSRGDPLKDACDEKELFEIAMDLERSLKATKRRLKVARKFINSLTSMHTAGRKLRATLRVK